MKGTRRFHPVLPHLWILFQTLDREAKAHYTCMAKSAITGFPLSLNVIVEDDNDNTPKFQQKTMNISLSETTPKQTSLSLGSATDEDVGEFTTQGYEIADGECVCVCVCLCLCVSVSVYFCARAFGAFSIVFSLLS